MGGKDKMLPGLELEFIELGFSADAANMGKGRIVDIGDDEFGLDESFSVGNVSGEPFFLESDIQFGIDGESDCETFNEPVDCLACSTS